MKHVMIIKAERKKSIKQDVKNVLEMTSVAYSEIDGMMDAYTIMLQQELNKRKVK